MNKSKVNMRPGRHLVVRLLSVFILVGAALTLYQNCNNTALKTLDQIDTKNGGNLDLDKAVDGNGAITKVDLTSTNEIFFSRNELKNQTVGTRTVQVQNTVHYLVNIDSGAVKASDTFDFTTPNNYSLERLYLSSSDQDYLKRFRDTAQVCVHAKVIKQGLACTQQFSYPYAIFKLDKSFTVYKSQWEIFANENSIHLGGYNGDCATPANSLCEKNDEFQEFIKNIKFTVVH